VGHYAVHPEPIADPADRFLWTKQPAIPFLVIRGPQAFAGAENLTNVEHGVKGGVVTLKRQEYDAEKPSSAPISLAQRFWNFVIPPVDAYAPESAPHRYPILLLR
jgi:hypothetical protein